MPEDNRHDALENPEYYLWVRHTDNSLTIIGFARLKELHEGASPKDPTERLLAEDREWLRILISYALSEVVIEVPEEGPLPEWNPTWLGSHEE